MHIKLSALTLSTISCSALSALPMRRMQWWIRPGPRRPCAISKPRPSPRRIFVIGTRTLVKVTSACPPVQARNHDDKKTNYFFLPGIIEVNFCTCKVKKGRRGEESVKLGDNSWRLALYESNTLML